MRNIDIDEFEVGRKVGYWQHALSKIEQDMMKMQSKRFEVKQRLSHLRRLQEQAGQKVLPLN